MIYLITGKPGSGKTYFALNHLLKNYFFYDKKLGDWIKKNDINILSNIEGLRLNIFNLDEMITKAGGIDEFFNIEYQRKLIGKIGKVIYLIDEANRYFQKVNQGVLDFFIYHRHLGIDFYLITASEEGIYYKIRNLIEYTIEAAPRSKRLLREFRYRKIVEGDVAGRVVLSFDKSIFRLYNSMIMDTVEEQGSVMRKYVLFIVIMGVLGFCGFYYGVGSVFGKAGKVVAYNPNTKKAEQIDKEKIKEFKEKNINNEKLVVDARDMPKEDKKILEKDNFFIDNLDEYEYIELNRYIREDGSVMFYDNKRMLSEGEIMKLVEDGNIKVMGNRIYYKRYRGDRGRALEMQGRPIKRVVSDSPKTALTARRGVEGGNKGESGRYNGGYSMIRRHIKQNYGGAY